LHEISVSTDGETYKTLINYDGVSTTYTLSRHLDTLETGQIYRIRIRAINDIGWGDYSADLLAAMTAKP